MIVQNTLDTVVTDLYQLGLELQMSNIWKLPPRTIYFSGQDIITPSCQFKDLDYAQMVKSDSASAGTIRSLYNEGSYHLIIGAGVPLSCRVSFSDKLSQRGYFIDLIDLAQIELLKVSFAEKLAFNYLPDFAKLRYANNELPSKIEIVLQNKMRNTQEKETRALVDKLFDAYNLLDGGSK